MREEFGGGRKQGQATTIAVQLVLEKKLRQWLVMLLGREKRRGVVVVKPVFLVLARGFFLQEPTPGYGTTGSPLWEISYINKAKQMQYPL